jgi:ABC-type nitrate/sulfonate/bicarbonate transport system substrate-binding protein
VDAQPKPARPFTFILDFLPYGEYTPYFTALDKGWYKEEGLDVKILRGAGSGDTIKRIAVGQGEAGSADFSALTGARANEDIRVKAIAAYFRRPPTPSSCAKEPASIRRRTWLAKPSPSRRATATRSCSRSSPSWLGSTRIA